MLNLLQRCSIWNV